MVVIIERNGHKFMRNTSLLKKIPVEPSTESCVEDSDDDDLDFDTYSIGDLVIPPQPQFPQ